MKDIADNVVVESPPHPGQAAKCGQSMSASHDTREGKRVEEALRESEEKYRLLVENAGEAIVVVQGKRITFVNRKGQEMIGYEATELADRSFLDFIHPEDRAMVADHYRRRMQGSTVRQEYSFRVTNKRGEVRWVELRAVVIRWESNPATLNVMADITDRKQAEELLQQSEIRYRALFNQSGDYVLVLEMGSDGVLRIVDVNDAALSVHGYSRGEMVGQPITLLDSHIDPPVVKNRLLAMKEQDGAMFEVRHRRKDGSVFDVEVRAKTVHIGGKDLILSVERDITQRKKLEESLRHSQKMEAIGQLAGGVAHDFNNILAATMMRLAMLQARSNLAPDTREALKELEAGAQRAASLTKQLLMFSHRSLMEFIVLDVNRLIANLLKMVRRLIGEDIDLRFEDKPVLPPVKADSGMLEQVLVNLAVNARDAMPKGGRLMISTNAAEISEEQAKANSSRRPGKFVCLSVADSGCGMDQDTLKRIFEPFFTTKEVGKGTGLGLATVHGIVAQHEGWVEVESQVGKGSEFRVYLPAVERKLEDIPEEAVFPAAVLGGNETILVVEDDLEVRRNLVELLRLMGYRVFEAPNGVEAVALWEKERAHIDLLFTDMVMPEGITGRELAERLQGEKPELKVIISSGYSEEIIQHGQPRKPGTTYLPKPYEGKTLGATVRSCLAGNSSTT
jgi:PAS domain S-box-containing protein